MRWVSALVVVVALGLGGATAFASKPIPWTMKGCVVDGIYYQIDGDSGSVVRWRAKFELGPYEGKSIEISGTITPGDYFAARSPVKDNGVCTPEQRMVVRYVKAAEIRLDAGRAEEAGKLDEAEKLIEQAITAVTPADCDMFTDRAEIKTRKGDLKAAAADLAILEAKKCRFRVQLNWLLLEDLGNALRARGAKQSAVKALTLALANCDADICREPIKKDLAAARQMKP